MSQALSDYASKGTTVSIWPAFDKWQHLCELIVFLIWHEMVMIIYKLNNFLFSQLIYFQFSLSCLSAGDHRLWSLWYPCAEIYIAQSLLLSSLMQLPWKHIPTVPLAKMTSVLSRDPCHAVQCLGFIQHQKSLGGTGTTHSIKWECLFLNCP